LRRAAGEGRFRQASQKHIAAETRPVDKRVGGGADRIEAAKPELQCFGKFCAFRFPALCRLREQKARLQIGEPSRRDEIIRGEFETQAARRRDKFEILLDKRQHGNLAQIHFLPAREVEQKIERAFKTLDIGHEVVFLVGLRGILNKRQIQRLALPVRGLPHRYRNFAARQRCRKSRRGRPQDRAPGIRASVNPSRSNYSNRAAAKPIGRSVLGDEAIAPPLIFGTKHWLRPAMENQAREHDKPACR
jgi:hypothetical protein